MRRRVILGTATFLLGLAVLHQADNPPPTRAELHAEATGRAIAAADATVTRLSGAAQD